MSENLPQSETKSNLSWVTSATVAAGFEQGWGVFAPVPASLEVHTYAIVTLPGDEELRWDPPSGNLFTGSARFERWRKWSTNIRTAQNEPLWETNAWRISEDAKAALGVQPVLIRMVRRWAEAPGPGEGFDREYGEFMFYAYDPINEIGRVTPVGEDAATPSTEAVPNPGAEAPVGELPNPGEEPIAQPTPVPRDPAETTTQQQDPIDFSESRPDDLLFKDQSGDQVAPDTTPAAGEVDQ